jgi:hypothetical protein
MPKPLKHPIVSRLEGKGTKRDQKITMVLLAVANFLSEELSATKSGV